MKKIYFFSLIIVILALSIFLYIKSKTLNIGIIANFSGDETFTMKDIISTVNLF